MRDLGRFENITRIHTKMALLVAHGNMSDLELDGVEQIYNELITVYNNGTILTFIVLMLGLAANIALLWSLLHLDRKSRLRPFLINLAVADLLVCCFTIAMELGWRLTVTWTAGDSMCRFLSFTKTLGLYLEAFVVLAMSIDRFYVVRWPLMITGQRNRMRVFLAIAWIAAVVFSSPQAVVFHVEVHPEFADFIQCVTLNSFSSRYAERGYVVFGILAMYVVPLIIILIVSLILLWTIRSPSTQKCRISGTTIETLKVEYLRPGGPPAARVNQLLSPCRSTDLSLPGDVGEQTNFMHKPMRLRLHTGLELCHTDTIIRKRARSRTLKLSMLIVLAFILCYTPYAIMICLAFVESIHDYEPDEFTAQLTEGLLMLSLSFSTIMNPLVYGSYMIYTRKRWRDVLNCFRRRPSFTSAVV